MKKQALYCIALNVLCLFILRAPVAAQSMEQLLTVEIPFEFQINEQQLPAGKYVIKRSPQMPQVLLLQSPSQNTLVMVQTTTLELTKEAGQPGLLFKGYGTARFLAEIKVAGSGNCYTFPKSKTERRLAQLSEAKIIRTRLGGMAAHD